jgi:hypothetical protein
VGVPVATSNCRPFSDNPGKWRSQDSVIRQIGKTISVDNLHLRLRLYLFTIYTLEYEFPNYLQALILSDHANKNLSFCALSISDDVPLALVLFKEVELNVDGSSAAEGRALGALEGRERVNPLVTVAVSVRVRVDVCVVE